MRTPRWLSVDEWLAALAGLAAAGASIAGFIPGLYRDRPVVIAQSHGYDLGNLVVVGVLFTSLAFAARGSVRGRLVAVGALGCLLYSFVTYAFVLVVNPVSLLYMAVLGFGGWAFLAGLANIEDQQVEATLDGRLARRTSAAFFALVVVLFGASWLRQILGAAGAGVPTDLVTAGWATNPVWVLDLCFVLPLMGLTAYRLATGRPGGTRIALSLLVFMALLGITILAMAVWMAADGQALDPVMPALFVTTTLVSGALAGIALAPRPPHGRPRPVSAAGPL